MQIPENDVQNPQTSIVIGDGQLTINCVRELVDRKYKILKLVTDHPEVKQVGVGFGLDVISHSEMRNLEQNIGGYDFLFSIINSRKVSSKLIEKAKRSAINFHDAPLPRYAGLNVTSWAIIGQETEFGVTWHEMLNDFDAGPILKQSLFGIERNETAFSLRLKCLEQGQSTFSRLLDDIENNALNPIPQDLSQRSVYLSTKRVRNAGLIDWNEANTTIDALIRGLSFEGDENPLATAKVAIGGQIRIVARARLGHSESQGPGFIHSVNAQYIEVGTASGTLCIETLASLDGAPVNLESEMRRANLIAGSTLAAQTDSLHSTVVALDAGGAGAESYWRKAYRSIELIDPFELSKSKTADDADTSVHWSLPEQLFDRVNANLRNGEPANTLVELYVSYLARLSSAPRFSVGLQRPDAAVTDDLSTLVCAVVPLNIAGDISGPASRYCDDIRDALDLAASNGTVFQDLFYRTPGLQAPSYPMILGSEPCRELGAAKVWQYASTDGFELTFNAKYLSQKEITLHCTNFESFLESVLDNLDQPLQQVPLLSKAERQKILYEWNETEQPVPEDVSVQDLISAFASSNPTAQALSFRSESITYGELLVKADVVAHRLSELGVAADTLVGVYLERSIGMVVALLGILRSGAAYVPLDPTYPADRIKHMIEDSGLNIVVTSIAGKQRLPAKVPNLISVEDSSPVAHTADLRRAQHADLAYVIYTSGSTGLPKGVMIEHGNLANFLIAMDSVLEFDGSPGTWLAVTSISFDISVLELLWTLSRGFKVVIQEEIAEQSSTSLANVSSRNLDIGLFYFSGDAQAPGEAANRYQLLLDGAKFADKNGFSSIWTPERHFHQFGGLYPNPSVTSAAVAAVTDTIAIRAGSIVLPLHDPIRVAEEWSVVDNLSSGRVGFSFASGWHANDFILNPDNYDERKQKMFEGIETIKELWSGGSVTRPNGQGESFTARIYPPPVQKTPPIWITTAGNVETFQQAGEGGYNVLTNLLGQSIDDLAAKIAAYRAGRSSAGHEGAGQVCVMVHTFVGTDVQTVKEIVHDPFCDYLKTSFNLVQVAPWAFPAFSQPSKAGGKSASTGEAGYDPDNFTTEDLDALAEHAFERYFETAGIFGTPQSCLALVNDLKNIGVDELACLVDFGVENQLVLDNLPNLATLLELSNPATDKTAPDLPLDTEDYSIAAQLARHDVTHFQCTPSMARMLAVEEATLVAMKQVDKLLLGGEALPADLASQMRQHVGGKLINVYGPTETTIWSTSSVVDAEVVEPYLGKPFANTQIYILDQLMQPTPVGIPGELCIGGKGVVRGYLHQQELTDQKFVPNLFSESGGRIYKTGDLAAFEEDGNIRFLGRMDHQVKFRGYRIELGEIESLLNRNPSVRESVVVAIKHEESLPERLVAYVVGKPVLDAESASDIGESKVSQWHTIWDETYADSEVDSSSLNNDPTLDTSGWLDSFSQEVHDKEHMQEWVDTTCSRIGELSPQRVLEVGCGTGMLLYRLAPQCKTYVGVDFSASAIAKIQQQLPSLNLDNVTLIEGQADSFAVPANQKFDTIIINSVVQYFPSADYLTKVIEYVSTLLTQKGKIFIGDVRSLAHQDAFYAKMESLSGAENRSAEELQAAIDQRKDRETELLIDPEFFRRLPSAIPELTGVNVQLKRGWQHNEMTVYRYDVVITNQHLAESTWPDFETLDNRSGVGNKLLDTIADRLQGSDTPLKVSGIANPRLNQDMSYTTGGQADEAIEPEALFRLNANYSVEVHWSDNGELDSYDAYFKKSADLLWNLPLNGVARPLEKVASEPHTPKANEKLVALLRKEIAQSLPQFMMPSDIVVIDKMPLTPNGKINRNALPKPSKSKRLLASAYVAPKDDVEQSIANILEDLLNLSEVSSTDNFFDIGANSLLIVQANARLSETLGRRVPLVSMYRFPSIAQLANFINDDNSGEKSVDKGSERGARRKVASRASKRRQARS